MADEPYELVLVRSATRAIAKEPHDAIAATVIDLVTGPLIEHRVGWAERCATNWPAFTARDAVRTGC